MNKLLFIPVGVIAGILAGKIGDRLFETIWSRIDDQEVPDPHRRETDWRKLALALALEGVIFKVVRGLIDHGSRRAFSRVTGSWPGESEEQAPAS